MAERPIFIPNEYGTRYVTIEKVKFDWYPGFSIAQKQKSIDSLHSAAREKVGIKNILEISTKSPENIGVLLSAFNLKFTTIKYKKTISVESAYQSSKVFKNGGPFTDIRYKSSREAKKDIRLRTSGCLIGFKFYEQFWGTEPKTAFYDWLYVNALLKNDLLVEKLKNYSAFTDIEFNPSRSISCQAYSAALFLSISKRGLIDGDFLSKEHFIKLINMQDDGYVQKDWIASL